MTPERPPAEHRCGLIAVVGRPNVGKSTLTNTLVGQKVSIVSDKAQTTRHRILGIVSRPEVQLILVDTPGMHAAHHRLGKILNETARQSLADADAVLVVVDVSKRPHKEDESLARLLQEAGMFAGERSRPVVLALNKMDLLKPLDVEAHYEAYTKLFPTERVTMTSFTRFDNVDRLVGLLTDAVPEGPAIFPEDEVTDQPMRTLAAELIREKALRLTRQEVPHAVATHIEGWEESEGLVKISAVILVETDGQKAILIGKRGAMLKRIGTEARLEIEEMTEKRVFLELFVKVRTAWRQNERILRELEYL